MGVQGFVVLETGFVFVYEELSGARPIEDPMSVVKEMRFKLARANKLARVERQDIPVLLTPYVLPTLLMAVEMGLSGKNVAKGISPLAQKLGEKIFNEEFTLLEDPLKPYGWGSTPFDAEGVPTKKTKIIDKGHLKEFLLDLYSASKLGTSSNGHAKRGYSSIPIPGLHSVDIPEGSIGLNEILKNREVLFVEDVIGVGQSNLLAGDFSLNVGLGFIVKEGEFVGRVKDTMISGNVYEIFKRPFVKTRERKTFRSFNLPYLLVEGVSITAK